MTLYIGSWYVASKSYTILNLCESSLKTFSAVKLVSPESNNLETFDVTVNRCFVSCEMEAVGISD